MHDLRTDSPLRVAAYCRVSTDKDDQLNSLAAQQRFFRSYVTGHPGWTLFRVFADEGLSGTSIKRRPQFVEMIQRAMNGDVDLIITKEVSRFARNTVDALQVTRQLKDRGVGVIFLNDNIDTRDNDGEFRLTIMASVAQEESRKISDRTRWGQLQAMKRGVVFGNSSIYGYTIHHGELFVDPEQAEVVRRIYHKFLAERKGTHTIARELTESGVRPPLRPTGSWTSSMVLKILKNEKYCGDLLQKKYRTTDYLSHRKILNDGAEEKIFLRDHHEPVISRDQFEAAQEELAKRAGMAEDKTKFSSQYWFSGKIRCGSCGRSFTVKRTGRARDREYQRFVCRGRCDASGKCQMRSVRGEIILASAQRILQELPLDSGRITAELLQELRMLRKARIGEEADAQKIQAAIQRQLDRRIRAQEAYLDGDLSRADMRRLTARCEAELERLQAQMEKTCQQQAELERGGERLEEIRAFLERELAGGESVLDEVIQRITVYEDHFIVEAVELPVRFCIRAEGSGMGKNFRVTVTECVPVTGAADT